MKGQPESQKTKEDRNLFLFSSSAGRTIGHDRDTREEVSKRLSPTTHNSKTSVEAGERYGRRPATVDPKRPSRLRCPTLDERSEPRTETGPRGDGRLENGRLRVFLSRNQGH